MVVANWISTPGQAVVRRSAFEAVGGFSESVPRAVEDWDLWLRLAAIGPIGFVDEVLLDWRQHGGSLSNDGRIMADKEDAYRLELAESPKLDAQQRTTVSTGRRAELRRRRDDKVVYARAALRSGGVIEAVRQAARAAKLTAEAQRRPSRSLHRPLGAVAVPDRLDVVIATRNRHDDLPRALRSLTEQSDAEIRVTIVDQSDDPSARRPRSWRSTTSASGIGRPRRGRSRAMNEAVTELVDADLITFTDDDCEFPPDWAASVVNAAAANPTRRSSRAAHPHTTRPR